MNTNACVQTQIAADTVHTLLGCVADADNIFCQIVSEVWSPWVRPSYLQLPYIMCQPEGRQCMPHPYELHMQEPMATIWNTKCTFWALAGTQDTWTVKGNVGSGTVWAPLVQPPSQTCGEWRNGRALVPTGCRIMLVPVLVPAAT